MKKILSIILTITMLLTVSVASVSAATAIDGGEGTSSTGKTDGDYTLGVAGEVVPDPNTAATISFEIGWDNSQFTYVEPSSGKWNAEDHVYEGVTAGGWDDSKMNITVKNHSNTGIVASFTFAEGDVAGMKGVFNMEYLALVSADSDQYRQATSEGAYPAPTAVSEFKIDKKSPAITGNVTDLGTITVSVKQALVVGNENELQNAVAGLGRTGGTVYLGDNITLMRTLGYDLVEWGGTDQVPLTLDLAWHTLEGNIWVEGLGSHAVIQNGHILYYPTNLTSNAECMAIYAGVGVDLAINNIEVDGFNALALYVDENANVTVRDTDLFGRLVASAIDILGFHYSRGDITVYVHGNLTLATAGAGLVTPHGTIEGRVLFRDSSNRIKLAENTTYKFNLLGQTLSISGNPSGEGDYIIDYNEGTIISVDNP